MKVALVGTAPGWEEAPWGNPAWDIWGLNDAYQLFGADRHCTRWFELHGDTPLTRARRPPDHFERIAAMNIPVYYLHGDPPAPQARRFPVEEAARVGRDYFACTTAYQIALTLLEDADEIAPYGMPFQGNREVVVERPCVSWWLGLAEGRGVRVTVPAFELLYHPFRYALEDEHERRSVYRASWHVRESLNRWLPAEAERLGIINAPGAGMWP